MTTMDPLIQTKQRAKNLRTGWILGSIALLFFVGFLIRVFMTK